MRLEPLSALPATQEHRVLSVAVVARPVRLVRGALSMKRLVHFAQQGNMLRFPAAVHALTVIKANIRE